ncbi:MAG: Hsp70 family protein, partial [Herpetosiphonaceae bacterium]|nr:Hsp70 family protein [Herpetosiphonaceae bacterium]
MRLGIDIGTDVAQAALLDPAGAAQLVRFADGSTRLPALARQTMHGLQVGSGAAQSLVGNAETTVVGCTRLMGRASDLPRRLLDRLAYPVRDVAGEALCDLLYAEVRASEIYGQLVRALVDAAETMSGEVVDEVVLTVPASAENRFRLQARAAAEAAGVRVMRLINQPTAAILAADLPATAQRVAVVNCAGGATEISLVERMGLDTRVVATAGDLTLGGDDLAWAVADKLAERFHTVAGLDLATADSAGLARAGLRRAAGEALETLCIAPETLLVLDHGGGFGRDLATVVRRSDTDLWLAPQMEQLSELCARVLGASGWSASQLDAVVLIGEAAHLPHIQLTVAAAFERPAASLHTLAAQTLAVRGAALISAQSAPLVWDVTPYPLGINCYYGNTELFSPIIAANTPIPTPAVGMAGACTEPFQTREPDQTEVRLDVLQYRGPRVPQTHGKQRVFPKECEQLGSWLFSGLHPQRGK